MAFRPAGMSDSDDSEDDFYYGGSTTKKPNYHNLPPPAQTEEEVQEAFHSNTVLVAIKNDGNLEDVEAAMTMGKLNISKVHNRGWSFLHHACQAGNPKMIEYFLNKGADVNQLGEKDGFPPFMALSCSEKCHDIAVMKECLNLLVAKGAQLTLPDYRQMTALMFAARDNLPELVELFIQLGMNVNQQDSGGMTSLHYAADRGCGRVIRALLEHGANVHLVSEDGVTAYELAGTRNLYQISEVLYRVMNTKWTPGADPSLLKELTNPENNKDLKREQRVVLPQKELIEMTLEKLGLQDLYPTFKEHKIDFLSFLRLTDDDLKSMGVKAVGTRHKVLDSIRVLHNAEWNKSALNSIYLQGIITSPEVVCMLHDVRTHLDFMTQSMTYLQNRLKAEPKALISGSESARAPELSRYTQATLLAVEELRAEAQSLKQLFHQLEGGTEFVIGDMVDIKKKGKMKWYICGTVVIISALAASRIRLFMK